MSFMNNVLKRKKVMTKLNDITLCLNATNCNVCNTCRRNPKVTKPDDYQSYCSFYSKEDKQNCEYYLRVQDESI
jgi:hypothetical protein